jgi:S1-C subfamily serine protease
MRLHEKILLAVIVVLSMSLLLPQRPKYVSLAQKCIEKSVMITVVYTNGAENHSIRGAGVFVSPAGYILTARHLFNYGEGDDTITKKLPVTIELYTGELIAADLVAVSRKSDLALLKVYAVHNPAYATIENPFNLEVGQEVIAVGYPLGLNFSVSNGIISALNRDLEPFYNVTQSNCTLNPGNSGGPLFNLRGNLVGINSFIIPSTFLPVFSGLGFSVQSGQIIEFLTHERVLFRRVHTIPEIVSKVIYGGR